MGADSIKITISLYRIVFSKGILECSSLVTPVSSLYTVLWNVDLIGTQTFP